jgi:hypothetical protein
MGVTCGSGDGACVLKIEGLLDTDFSILAKHGSAGYLPGSSGDALERLGR